jgi:hypothetical protein
VTFSYSLATAIGQVRMLVPDRDAATAIFDDDEIAAFLVVEASNVKRATALAIETIASDQALLLKVLTLGQDSTDGAKLSDALLKRATTLRDQAAIEDVGVQDGEGLFEIAEQVIDPFGAREYRRNEVLRGG